MLKKLIGMLRPAHSDPAPQSEQGSAAAAVETAAEPVTERAEGLVESLRPNRQEEKATEVPRLSVKQLRRIVTDSSELSKGTQIADAGLLSRLARFQNRLFAEAAGSGQRPYRVSLSFDGSKVAARCSCFAARSRPYCKHASALLVTWARSPEAFVQADEPPVEQAAGRKKRQVRRGKRKPKELQADGVSQIQTMVREIAGAGVATVTGERIEQIRQLGSGLREYRLRRLSVRCLSLADLLGGAGDLDEEAYAGLVADLLLTAAKVRKHLDGEDMDPRHVEELIGRTWRAGDREPLSGLELVEYYFRSWETPDRFLIRESRFADTAAGTHYSEKQILPHTVARRLPAKPSYAGVVLSEVTAGRYPGYEPFRLHLETEPGERTLTAADLQGIAEGALSVGEALNRYLEHRRDLFAPSSLPVTVACPVVAAVEGRLLAVDGDGAGLHLLAVPGLEQELGDRLQGVELLALIGDLDADGVLPRLRLHAAITGRGDERQLITLTGSSELPLEDATPRPWIEVAREAGLSAAAISLGEIRGEMARALVTGLAAWTPRLAAPLVARLGDLRLARLAAVVEQAVAAEEPQARVATFIKAYHLAGIALLRMAGVSEVDLAALSPVPGAESLCISQPAKPLVPARVAALRAEGRLSSFEAAWHYGHHFQLLGPDALANDLETWANGAARPYLVGALAGNPQLGITAARRVLQSACGRTAQVSAITALSRLGGRDAEAVLENALQADSSKPIRPLLLAALVAQPGWTGKGRAGRYRKRLEALDQMIRQLREGGDLGQRSKAARVLGETGSPVAITALRQAFLGDRASAVREEAAYALAELGDAGITETLVRRLGSPGADCRKAIIALGRLADLRGLAPLLRVYESGARLQLTAEAIIGFGILTITPVLDLVIANPRLGKRDTLRSILAAQPEQALGDRVLSKLEEIGAADAFSGQAKGILHVLERCKPVCSAAAVRILEMTAGTTGKGIKPLRTLAERLRIGK